MKTTGTISMKRRLPSESRCAGALSASTRKPSRRLRGGFSLIELLFVIAIIAIVAVLSTSSISAVQRASAVGSGGSALLDYLSLARQAAVTRNTPVRIWFCRDVDDRGEPKETLLAYWEKTAADGSLIREAVDRELKLHSAVAFAEALSSVLGVSGTSEDPKYDEQSPTFRFLSDGSADLPDGSAHTLTLVPRNEKDADANDLPDNFFTLQIDQQTGVLQTFRPQ